MEVSISEGLKKIIAKQYIFFFNLIYLWKSFFNISSLECKWNDILLAIVITLMGGDLNTLNAILYIIFINNIVMLVANCSKLRYHLCQTSGDEVISASRLKLCCI